jgi:hypothetical protein
MSVVISATGIVPDTLVGVHHLNGFELEAILLAMQMANDNKVRELIAVKCCIPHC